jgi:hypothetical protein
MHSRRRTLFSNLLSRESLGSKANTWISSNTTMLRKLHSSTQGSTQTNVLYRVQSARLSDIATKTMIGRSTVTGSQLSTPHSSPTIASVTRYQQHHYMHTGCIFTLSNTADLSLASGTRNATRSLSSASSSPPSSAEATAIGASSASTAASPLSSPSNIFLDNIGKIFLTAIGLIIATLVRSHYGTKNKTALRDALEQEAPLDPIEIQDLRLANSELTAPAYRFILQYWIQKHGHSRDANNAIQMTHAEWIDSTRQALELYIEQYNKQASMIPTIELGHLLDRVVLANQVPLEEPRSIVWWASLLLLAVQASVPERIQMLYEVLKASQSTTDSDSPNVTIEQVQELVGCLQDSCQLVLETQVIPTEDKYPVQQHKRGTSRELVQWDGTEALDVDAMAAILRSKAVCAWGECYHKRKHV